MMMYGTSMDEVETCPTQAVLSLSQLIAFNVRFRICSKKQRHSKEAETPIPFIWRRLYLFKDTLLGNN